ncbi:MAG: VWA domain-containing protein [Thermodesulfobacteriota bacterium]
MNFGIVCRIVAGFLIAFSFSKISFADTNILYILDGSGSMWGQVDGVPKIQTAKEVLGNLMGDLPSDTKVGLMTYGHRAEGDCEDVEVLAPIGSVKLAELRKKLEEIKPKGKTPIGFALESSLAEFQSFKGENNNVILISDGIETCGGDPSETAAELAASGVNLRVHVVGFDVTEEQRSQLEAIASSGGGKYFNASSTEAFKEAIVEVKAVAIVEPTPEPTPMPTPEPKKEEVPKMSALPRGGDSIETAVPLSPGDYLTDHEIPKGSREYFSVQLKAGQTLEVGFRTSDKEYPYAGATIYNGDKILLVEDRIIGTPSTLNSISWTTNSDGDEYRFYVAVGNTYDKNALGMTYYISVKDNFDLDSTTDAGDTFEKAMKIEPGVHEGFNSGSRGDDNKDFYVLAINAGQTIRLKLTPPTELGYRISIWDQDRVRVASKSSANAGAITRLTWTAPEDQEDVFILIEPDRFPGNSSALPYTIDVAVE